MHGLQTITPNANKSSLTFSTNSEVLCQSGIKKYGNATILICLLGESGGSTNLAPKCVCYGLKIKDNGVMRTG